jgi:hypothetical protein
VGDWPGTSAALFGRPAGTMRLPFANIVFSDESVEISCLDGFVPSRGFSFTHCARVQPVSAFDAVVVAQASRAPVVPGLAVSEDPLRVFLAAHGFGLAHRTAAYEIWWKRAR